MRRLRLTLAAGLLAVVGIAPALLAQQTGLPAPVRKLKPHQIVESVLNNRTQLGLTDEQVEKLNAWHVGVRDEKHQFAPTGRTKPPFDTMKPMISRDEAYRNTVAVLTPDQRQRWLKLLEAAPAAKQPPAVAGADPMTHTRKDNAPPSTDTSSVKTNPLEHKP